MLNKSDLANEIENKKWLKYFEKKQIPAILCNSNNGEGANKIINKLNEMMSEEKNIAQQKGRNKIVRAMIIGIPNVGKSSFINRIAKKTAAQTGNKPGVTRKKQWIRVSDRIELLDTPGVLWPKINNEKIGMYLAFTGTIKDDVLQTEEIGFELLKTMIKNYMQNLIERYKLSEEQIKNITQNQELGENEKVLEIMNMIGKKRGAVISGEEINIEKVANILIDDFRSGRLGRITLEKVEGEEIGNI